MPHGVRKDSILEFVMTEGHMNKGPARRGIRAIVAFIRRRLDERGEAKLFGLGKFVMRPIKACKRRNFYARTTIDVPASRRILFKVSPKLRAQMKARIPL